MWPTGFDWRNPFKKLTRTLAVPPWLIFTLLDFRLIERETDGRLTWGALYLPHPARTVFHNAAFSVQVCFPFFFSVQIKPFEKGRYFQMYFGFRPHSGWSGGKFRFATYEAEVGYNPGMASGWNRGWS